MREEDLIDMAAIGFGLISLVFGLANTRKNGDGFMVAVGVIFALVAFGWAYWN